MGKQLKIWNGTVWSGDYKYGSVYVAAYSMKQAVELINKALGTYMSPSIIKNYYHKGCWGRAMDGIVPTEPCVYASKEFRGKPEKLI